MTPWNVVTEGCLCGPPSSMTLIGRGKGIHVVNCSFELGDKQEPRGSEKSDVCPALRTSLFQGT